MHFNTNVISFYQMTFTQFNQTLKTLENLDMIKTRGNTF